MEKIKILRMAAYHHIMDLSAMVLWNCSPLRKLQKRAWYFACFMAKMIEWILGPRRPDSPSFKAQILNSLITRFNKIQPSFPIDISIPDRILIHEALSVGKGALVATVHTQLSLTLNSIRDLNGRPPIFVGHHHDDMAGWNWGSNDPIESLVSTSSTILLKIRTALSHNRIVVSFVDFREFHKAPMYISPNIFSLAKLLQVPLIYMHCRIEDGGQIRVDLGAEPTDLTDQSRKADPFAEFIGSRLGMPVPIMRPKCT